MIISFTILEAVSNMIKGSTEESVSKTLGIALRYAPDLKGGSGRKSKASTEKRTKTSEFANKVMTKKRRSERRRRRWYFLQMMKIR